MILVQQASQPDCRTVVVPACEPDICAAQDAAILSLADFQMKIRDTVDFRVDFSQWIAQNGNPTMSNAVFAAAVDSPSTPTIEGQAFAGGKAVVVLSAPDGAKPGDAFHIDVTATFAATAGSATEVAIPERVLVRRIHVVLVNG